MGHPRVLLADQPTGDLDSQMGGEIIQILTDLNSPCHLAQSQQAALAPVDTVSANTAARMLESLRFADFEI